MKKVFFKTNYTSQIINKKNVWKHVSSIIQNPLLMANIFEVLEKFNI